MVDKLPDELLEQAKILLTLPPNQANLRRAVSTAYYSLFHLLVRSTILNWSDPLQRARIGRMFEHERMKKISGATIKSVGIEIDLGDSNSIEVIRRTELTKVAQAFIILQQARHDADYNLERPLDPADAIAQVDRANSAFVSWEVASDSEVGREYLFSLLFKERERTYRVVPCAQSSLQSPLAEKSPDASVRITHHSERAAFCLSCCAK